MNDVQTRSPKHSKGSVVSSVHSHRPAGWRAVTQPQARPTVGVWVQLRPLVRRVHFIAGLLVAPLLLVLCLTGLVYVFSPQIHDDLYRHQLYVEQVGDTHRPVVEQVAAAMAAHPEAEVLTVVPPPEPGRTTQVNLSVPGGREPGEARTVYVDPYTNYVSGELTTVHNRLPANVWLRHLHSDLHLGEAGRLYSEVAASWLPVVALGGLALWVGRQGARRRSTRELLVPAPRGRGDQSRLRSVHGPLGLWSVVGLLGMAVTGLSMSRFAGRLFDGRIPALAVAPVGVPPGGTPIDLDRVLAVARSQGLGGELELRPPAAPDRPFTVRETSPGLPVRKGSISVDPYTADVAERIGWGDYGFLAQLRVLGTEAHTGVLFGPANQILLALLMILTIGVVVVGYRMWWKRGPYQGTLPSAPPPALRQLTRPVAAAVVVVTVALGWLMPAFGLSLMAFLAVDLGISAVRRRRQPVGRIVAAGALLAVGGVLGAALLAASPVSDGVGDDDGASVSEVAQGGGTPSAAGPAPSTGPASTGAGLPSGRYLATRVDALEPAAPTPTPPGPAGTPGEPGRADDPGTQAPDAQTPGDGSSEAPSARPATVTPAPAPEPAPPPRSALLGILDRLVAALSGG